MLSLITANLGGCQDPEKLKIFVSQIKELDPDIILLQEVAESEDRNILDLLKKQLNFAHSEFTFKHDFSKDYGKGILQEESLIEGLGILSKLKFTSQRKDLPIIKGQDRWPRVAVKYTFTNFSICNLHNSKIAESRALATKELPETDIYAGDFNMQPDELAMNFKQMSSFAFKKYVSYPSKNLTLDYVLISKGKFIDLKVIENVSDHNGLFVKIQL